jgi:hypothetical protein
MFGCDCAWNYYTGLSDWLNGNELWEKMLMRECQAILWAIGLEAKFCSDGSAADLCSRFSVLVPSVVEAVCIDKLCFHFDMLE